MAEAAGEVEPLPWTVYAGVGVGWYLTLTALPWLGLEGATPRLWVSAVMILALGGICWYNGRACGAVHCRISGPGYVLVGLVAVLSATGLVDVGVDVLIWAFVAVMLASYGIEAVVGRSEPEKA